MPADRAEGPSDAELVAAYRSGDERAAAELVRRHAAALSRFLYASGCGKSDLDDMVQETLFRAFRKVATWRGQSSMRSWLCTIGANLLRDEYRKHRGRQMLTLEDRDIPDTADPHAESVAADAEERLRQGLSGLPRLQREVFLLRAQQGRDYEEIAAALGTTPAAARVHYHHAVKRLRTIVTA